MERTYPGFAALLVALSLGATATPARAFVPPNTNVGHRGSSEMVYVAGASFKLGVQASWGGATPGQAYSGGDPAGVGVHVSSFSIDRLEVTAAQYHACVLAGACVALTLGDTTDAKYTQACTYGKSGHENHPINCVVHAEAARYCVWAGKRLPTEAEFELAERGPTGKPFPWGDDPPTPKHVNACDASLARESQTKLGTNLTSMWTDGGDDGWAFTAPVGTYPAGASPYGALDMSGNVEEWVADPWWDMTGGATGPKPTSSSGGDDRVVRGGSWDLNSFDSFAATRRVAYQSTTRAAWLGFRCARDG